MNRSETSASSAVTPPDLGVLRVTRSRCGTGCAGAGSGDRSLKRKSDVVTTCPKLRAGDLGANGLTGNGVNKNLDPGLVGAFAGAGFTANNACLFFYAFTTNTTVTGTEFGCSDGATDDAFVTNFNSGGLHCFSDLLGAAARLQAGSPGNGFYMASRVTGFNNFIYFANSGTPWSAIANNNVGGTAPLTVGFLAFAFNNNGVKIQFANSTLSCMGIADGLTSAEGQCLYNAIQACRVSLGGGFR